MTVDNAVAFEKQSVNSVPAAGEDKPQPFEQSVKQVSTQAPKQTRKSIAKKAPSQKRTKGVKSSQAFRTISEVADEMGLAQHVLRFWESKFAQIKPMKRAGGRRYYRPADVRLLQAIRVLLHDEGYTIKGVQKLFKEQGIKATLQQALGTHAANSVEDDMPAPSQPVPLQPVISQKTITASNIPADTSADEAAIRETVEQLVGYSAAVEADVRSRNATLVAPAATSSERETAVSHSQAVQEGSVSDALSLTEKSRKNPAAMRALLDELISLRSELD